MYGFTVTARELGKLHLEEKPTAFTHLTQLGGADGIALKLSSNVHRGLTGDTTDLEQRKEAYVFGH